VDNETHILIADDHPIFRKGLRQVIEAESNLKVVAEADDGLAALEQITQLRPEIAILDIHMPHLSGFEVARAIRERDLKLEVIFLTMHKAEDIFNEAMNIGVKGYVLKECAVTDIVASVRSVIAGQPFISPQLSGLLLERSARRTELRRDMPSLETLTPAEWRVLKMLAEYKTSKEIAEELCIHPRTVDNHRNNICNKLGLHGTHSLMKFAVEHKSEI
jgi:DNA-binding NarL/FixJ family response regulator